MVRYRAMNVAFHEPDDDVVRFAKARSALGWQPNGLKLTRAGNTATGRLTVLEGTLVKLKATRGSWGTVEVTAVCGELANRELVADYGATGTLATQLDVAAWVDHCP